MRTRRRLVFSVIAVGLGLTVCLGLSEIIFRLKGHRTWRYQPDLERPTIHEPDPVLGWKNKPGSYLIPPYSSDAEAIKVTFLPDGRRATAEHPNPRPHTFLVFGGSITQGWAISDEATFAWKLQRKYPYVEVLNYGTTGYGTYQSILLFERLLSQSVRPALVVYGLHVVHERRNVGEAQFLRSLVRHSTRGHLDLPYCTLGSEGELQRHPRTRYPAWPLKEYLATTNFLEREYMDSRTSTRRRQKRAVTKKLLREMNDLCQSVQARLLVVMLGAFKKGEILDYAKFLRTQRIDFVDCALDLTPDLIVKGEIHPNAVANDFWAQCIDEYLVTRDML